MATDQSTLPPPTSSSDQDAKSIVLAEVVAEIERRGLAPDGSRKSKIQGPKTDDELWDAVYQLTGYRIPRVAVCTDHGHRAPFEVFADLYFERRTDVLCIGNRGGGKTTLSGFLHGCKNRYLPGFKGAISGAVEKQGHRAYQEFKRFIRSCAAEIVSTILSKTEWENGSELEVLGGTIKQLNGPHPHLAQMDEVELTTPDVFEEFQNMAQGDQRYRGQQLLTSTRKRSFGMVQRIVKECEDAVAQGGKTPWDVLIFCVFETMENRPDCGTTCGCDKVIKGRWDAVGDATPKDRTFMDVCGGRGLRADGFVRLEDVQKRFRQLSRMTWEAQQECLRPNIEGVVHKWVNEKHMVARWLPRPEFGQVFRSWDWGGENPHSVHFSQLLSAPIRIDGRLYDEGSLITFDEIFYSGGGYYLLGEKVLARTLEWGEHGFEWDIPYDFCDPAGASAKEDVKKAFRDSGYNAPRFRNVPAPVDVSVRKHISRGEEDRLYYVPGFCPNLDDEYTTYHWPDKKTAKNKSEAPVKEDDHAMDDQRYLIWNLYKLGLYPDSEVKDEQEPPSSNFEHKKQEDRGTPESPYKSKRRIAEAMPPDPSFVEGLPEHLSGKAGQQTVRSFDAPSVRR